MKTRIAAVLGLSAALAAGPAIAAASPAATVSTVSTVSTTRQAPKRFYDAHGGARFTLDRSIIGDIPPSTGD